MQVDDVGPLSSTVDPWFAGRLLTLSSSGSSTGEHLHQAVGTDKEGRRERERDQMKGKMLWPKQGVETSGQFRRDEKA